MGHQSKKVYVTNGKDSEEVVFSFFSRVASKLRYSSTVSSENTFCKRHKIRNKERNVLHSLIKFIATKYVSDEERS